MPSASPTSAPAVWSPPRYRTRADLYARFATDPVYFLQTCCTCPSYRAGQGIVALDPNAVQLDYAREHWVAGVTKDLVPKPRKHGFSLWRIALGLHAIHFGPAGRVFRIVVHRMDTAVFVSSMLRQLHASMWSFLQMIGEEPGYFLRPFEGDTQSGYRFPGGSAVRLDTAAGKGIGQADRNDDVYLTEATEYDDFPAVFEGLKGSQPLSSESRMTIDFNAVDGWMGTEVYNMLRAAIRGPGDPDWNGFTVFFRGIGSLPELYTPELLAEAERELRSVDPSGGRFRAIYPRTLDDLYQQRERCVHRRDDVEEARARAGGKYLVDELARLPRNLPVVMGVDTSTGIPGGDFQACTVLARHEDLWRELCPPLHERVGEDVFAEHVHELSLRFPGLVLVERNVGSAVIVRLRELGTETLYRHRFRDRDGRHRSEIGFPTTYETKRQMIVDTDRMLREGSLGLVTPALIEECAEVEWYSSGGVQKPTEHRRSELAGAPDRRGAHDDLWMSLNLCVQGIVRRDGTEQFLLDGD